MKAYFSIFLFLFFTIGCSTTESNNVVQTTSVASKSTPYHGPKYNLIVGKFSNRSSYGNGVFSDGNDKLGSQAKTILSTHLQQSGRFNVFDRLNSEENQREAKLSGIKQSIKGANITITGDVTEFGRKVIGDEQFFGILGRGTKQIAYAKVMLQVVDVKTSAIIYSVDAAGEYNLSNREIIGFGGTADYDSTLNGKVLDLAIREAVNKLVTELESHNWKL